MLAGPCPPSTSPPPLPEDARRSLSPTPVPVRPVSALQETEESCFGGTYGQVGKRGLNTNDESPVFFFFPSFIYSFGQTLFNPP